MEHRRALITVADGTRLAAQLWLPDERPAPVVIEALPYRMDDLTSAYASEYERLCDEGGFAVCRLDIRGTGSSEGIATDEYTAAELDDISQVIAWLAEQDWSNGRVGMYGTSWSGFNSLQVACLRPPALHAIVPIYASDDRYNDDVHYMGGALKAIDLIDYELYMVAGNALPPVPAVFGPGWREQWEHRVDDAEPWLLRWLEEQVDGPYWRHGSVRPDYGRIACPTMIVAGWADGYTNIVFRGFEALSCPKRVILGPWGHGSTATALPGPHIDLVPELIRWFRRWLAGEANGVDEEPPIAVFARRSTVPAPDRAEMRGEWRSEATWPPERLTEHVLRPAGEGTDTIHVRGEVGRAAWISCAGKLPWGLPDDQRVDDAFSLTYDWEPLAADLDVMGHPRVRLTVTSPVPVAYVSAKLCDVFPDGTSALACRGLLNLAHRHGHDTPLALEPGVPTDVEIELEATSWIFEPGHCVRLSLAGADWPNIWPPPSGAALQVDRASVELVLPVLDGPSPLPAPTLPPTTGKDTHAPASADEQPPTVWRIEDDQLGHEVRAVTGSGSNYEAPFGARVEERYEGTTGVSKDDPSLAWARGRTTYRITWPEADVRTETTLDLRSDAGSYHVVITLVAEELGLEPGDAGFYRERRFERVFPRLLA
jgi:predicted acyl esterase